MILVAGSTCVILYDTEARSAVGEIAASSVRYVSWNRDQTLIALISKHNITVANSKFEHLTMVHETIKIKSAAWDPSGVLVYTTLNHIKYCLKNGDNGIIKTIPEPVYVVKVKNNLIHVLTRHGKMQVIPFDPTEYRFKLALISRYISRSNCKELRRSIPSHQDFQPDGTIYNCLPAKEGVS